MNERSFFYLCCTLFFVSVCVLFVVVYFTPQSELAINPYTTAIVCDGTCSFHATVLGVNDKNETVFYKLNREVIVESVFFVGTKKPTFAVGDCVVVSGSAQLFKGKESIVIQTMSACKNQTK